MELRLFLTGFVLLGLLTGCGSTSSSPSHPRSESCDVSHLQSMLGKQIDRALVEDLKDKSSAQTVRVLSPNDAVTLDYNSQRLNIDIDENESITRLTCG